MAADDAIPPWCQKSQWVDSAVKMSIVLPILYLFQLSITEKGTLKYLTMVVGLLVSPSNQGLCSVWFFSDLFSRSLTFPSSVSKPTFKTSFEV